MTAAQDRWARKPWYCELCCSMTSQGHRKRHEESPGHRRRAATNTAARQSDRDFTAYLASLRPSNFTGFELGLYLRFSGHLDERIAA